MYEALEHLQDIDKELRVQLEEGARLKGTSTLFTEGFASVLLHMSLAIPTCVPWYVTEKAAAGM